MTTPDTRPVWITRDELTALLCVYSGQTISPNADSVLNRLEAAWDAAPADATEAVREGVVRDDNCENTCCSNESPCIECDRDAERNVAPCCHNAPHGTEIPCSRPITPDGDPCKYCGDPCEYCGCGKQCSCKDSNTASADLPQGARVSGDDTARPVWLTREQRDALWDICPSADPLLDVVTAWDDAPADSAEAVDARLRQLYGSREGFAPGDSEAVLRTLGYPGGGGGSARDQAAPPAPRVFTTDEIAAIEACPTPMYHATHRYCPSCPWTEEYALGMPS